MQTKKKKVLWFCWGPPDEATKEKAIAAGAMIRDASAYHEGDFVEKCDAVAGDHIPAVYSAQFPPHGAEALASNVVETAAISDDPPTTSRTRAK